MNRFGGRGNDAAGREQEERGNNDGYATNTIRQDSKRDLHYRLRQTIRPDGQPTEEICRAIERRRVGREHGQEREDTEHAQHRN